jgi:hypothetical protein
MEPFRRIFSKSSRKIGHLGHASWYEHTLRTWERSRAPYEWHPLDVGLKNHGGRAANHR